MSPAADKLLQKIKQLEFVNSDWSFHELKITVVLERIVARLEVHPELSKSLIYKGGFVLQKKYDTNRFTKDLDALSHNIDTDQLKHHIHTALSQDLNDGIWLGDIAIKELTEQGRYGGIRFSFRYHLGPPLTPNHITKLEQLHVDIGIGDTVQIMPKEKMNSLLPDQQISWRIYPADYIYSEKLQTAIERGALNSRAKDFFDLVILFELIEDNRALIAAIQDTFSNRNTDLPESFEQFLVNLDTQIVQQSWKGIQSSRSLPFESAIEHLTNQMRLLDAEFLLLDHVKKNSR